MVVETTPSELKDSFGDRTITMPGQEGLIQTQYVVSGDPELVERYKKGMLKTMPRFFIYGRVSRVVTFNLLQTSTSPQLFDSEGYVIL